LSYIPITNNYSISRKSYTMRLKSCSASLKPIKRAIGESACGLNTCSGGPHSTSFPAINTPTVPARRLA